MEKRVLWFLGTCRVTAILTGKADESRGATQCREGFLCVPGFAQYAIDTAQVSTLVRFEPLGVGYEHIGPGIGKKTGADILQKQIDIKLCGRERTVVLPAIPNVGDAVCDAPPLNTGALARRAVQCHLKPVCR